MSRGDGVQRWWFERTRNDSPQRLAGHLDEAWSVAFSPDGRILASGSDDSENDDTIKLWDAATGGLLRGWRADPGTVSALAFSPDGRTLASATLSPSKNLRLWDAATGRLLATLDGHTDQVRSVVFCPDGQIGSPRPDLTARSASGTSPPGTRSPRFRVTPTRCARSHSAPTAAPWPRHQTTGRCGSGTSPRGR